LLDEELFELLIPGFDEEPDEFEDVDESSSSEELVLLVAAEPDDWSW